MLNPLVHGELSGSFTKKLESTGEIAVRQSGELSPSALVIGLIIGVIMTAANVYLGLYAGMTVSASIPAAVIGMGVYRLIFKRSSILETNIIQTMASAGESLAAGVIFTLPALVIVGAWNEFRFWPTTLIAMSGGMLGVLFMIPLRRALIVDDKELIYPEGVACSQVLKSGDEHAAGGFRTILLGLGLGFVFKFCVGSLHLLQASLEKAYSFFGRVGFIGADMSPALLSVGYIVNLNIALLVFLGGATGWIIILPILSPAAADFNLLDTAWSLWSDKIRYIGVGAMLVGGAWSVVTVRRGISKGIQELSGRYKGNQDEGDDPLQTNLSVSVIGVLFFANLALVFSIYQTMLHSMGMTFFTTIFMALLSFLFVAVSSYIVGLVGSSNNPVSGMTICALLVVSGLLLVFGYHGESAILAALGVAAVVCCAACTSADCSQDLKTGYLVGASPKNQQIAQIIGICIPAFVIAPVLSLLHHAFGIGSDAEGSLKAPQATLFASLTKAIFGTGELPADMVWLGAGLGVVILILDGLLSARKSPFRLHLMPFAVGIYLPITLAVPMLAGGIIRFLSDRRSTVKKDEARDHGILLSSGLIAGEAITGVLLAIMLTLNLDLDLGISVQITEILSLIAFVGICVFLWKTAAKSAK